MEAGLEPGLASELYVPASMALCVIAISFSGPFAQAMSKSYERTIHFADTDAAGVVFFANYLRICHEAYEESLLGSGIDLRTFFSDNGIIIPVAKSEADYRRPLFCGNRVRVTLQVSPLSDNSYEIRYEMIRLGTPEKNAAHVRTEHVCIDSKSRTRRAFPTALAAWIAQG
jgi:1,4-dihydroxy-2-naphthoyl-CoA hydrolase